MTPSSEPSLPTAPAESHAQDKNAQSSDIASATATSPAPAPAETAAVPLAPIEAPPYQSVTAEDLAMEIGRLDYFMPAIVLIVAFFMASFAVRNSDFWLHLATGRLYAHGQFNFGTDPFSYTTEGTYWVNHSWLYDLVLYGLAAITGGPESQFAGALLVGLKALLVTAVAWLMLRMRRQGVSHWAHAVMAGFAVLAMGPRMLYQPMLVSVAFLALTVYILQSPRFRESGRTRPPQSPLRAYWWLPLLFLVWVNLDEWFILGPATVALYLIGQTLQQVFRPIRSGEDAPEPKLLSTLFLVLVVGLIACLANPHHYYAFALPAALGGGAPADVFAQDGVFRRFFLSPLDMENRTLQAMTFSRIAFWLLLLLSLISFGLSAKSGWRWWRFMLCLFFGCLAFYNERLIGFFAVVAAPLSALNFQDFVSTRYGPVPSIGLGWRIWSLGGRLLTLVVGFFMLLAAWPGWLHARPTDLRQFQRASWRIDVDQSMKQAAEQLAQWRRTGLIGPENRGLCYNGDIANVMAWFCSGEKGEPLEKSFFDFRLTAHNADIAGQYVAIRDALTRERSPETEFLGRVADWPAMFRKHKITHLILNRNDPNFGPVWVRALVDWDQWHLIHLNGRTCVFRWSDPRLRRAGKDNLPGIPRLDPAQYVFGSKTEPDTAEGPVRPPEVQEIWGQYAKGITLAPLDQEEADRYAEYFRIVNSRYPSLYFVGSEVGYWAGGVASALPSPGAWNVIGPGVFLLNVSPLRGAAGGSQVAFGFLFSNKDFGPAAASILAVRAGRRAIRANPDHAQSYFSLADAYRQLWRSQEEHWVAASRIPQPELTPRQRLRQVQIAALLQAGLKLKPDDEAAHFSLFEVFRQTGYLDLAVDHLREHLKYTSKHDSENRESFRDRLSRTQTGLRELELHIKTQQESYDEEAKNKPLIDKARIALSKGLGGQAIRIFEEASLQEVSSIEEADMMVFLLLSMGRPEEVRDSLALLREGFQSKYDWYKVLLEASTADHASAILSLDSLIEGQSKSTTENVLKLMHFQTFAGVGPGNLQPVNAFLGWIRDVADYLVIRGMLQLEVGAPEAAAVSFQSALDVNNKQPLFFENKAIAMRYLELIRAARQSP